MDVQALRPTLDDMICGSASNIQKIEEAVNQLVFEMFGVGKMQVVNNNDR